MKNLPQKNPTVEYGSAAGGVINNVYPDKGSREFEEADAVFICNTGTSGTVYVKPGGGPATSSDIPVLPGMDFYIPFPLANVSVLPSSTSARWVVWYGAQRMQTRAAPGEGGSPGFVPNRAGVK